MASPISPSRVAASLTLTALAAVTALATLPAEEVEPRTSHRVVAAAPLPTPSLQSAPHVLDTTPAATPTPARTEGNADLELAVVPPAAPVAPAALVRATHDHSDHPHAATQTGPTDGLVTPPAGSRCTLLISTEAPTACTHGPDPAPAGVDVTRYVPTEELQRQEPMYAETAARGGGSTDGSGQVVCDGDGVSGKRVEALYVVASDRKDRYSTLTSSFPAWARNADAMFNRSARLEGGARHLRFVTRSCALKVTRVVVAPSGDDTIGATISAVAAKGFNRPDRRYLMWVDANVYCGVGTLLVDDRRGDDNANNGYEAAYSRVDNACWNYAEAHELMHNLGGVQPSSPNATRGAHCRDESDQMCYDDDGTGPTVMRKICAATHENSFDCGHNDYFSIRPASGSWLASHWNTANSDFLMNPLAPVDRTPPPVPTGLAASPSETSVALRWSATSATDFREYQVYRDGVRVAAVTTPSWTNSGLTPEVRYRYQIRALDKTGNASALSSALVSGAVDRTPPRPPQKVWAEQSDTPKILWSLSPDSDVATYRVYRDGLLVHESPATTRWWQDAGFGLAIHHTYRVHAVDRAGNVSTGSQEMTVVDPDPLG